MSEKVVPITDGFWVCGCVKRDRKGRMTHIKTNHPSVTKCRSCKATKAEADAIAARIKDGR